MSGDIFTWKGRSIRLQRYGVENRDLRPWDAADEYLLHMADEIEGARGFALALQDRFGALSIGLASMFKKVYSAVDELVALEAIHINLNENSCPNLAVQYLMDLENYLNKEPEQKDVRAPHVFLRIPRALELLEFTLHRASCLTDADSVFYLGGMIKHIPDTAADYLRDIFEEVRVHKVVKKAIILECRGLIPIKLQKEFFKTYLFPDTAGGLHLQSLPGCFAKGKIDGATALLLQNIPDGLQPNRVVDMGCGIGILSIVAARKWPAAKVYGTDIYVPSVRSAKHNAFINGVPDISFLLEKEMRPFESESVDLVLSNPPFHSGSALDVKLTQRMFSDVRRSLVNGGSFFVVGNTGLNYDRILESLFLKVRLVVRKGRYSVFWATK